MTRLIQMKRIMIFGQGSMPIHMIVEHWKLSPKKIIFVISNAAHIVSAAALDLFVNHKFGAGC